MTSPGEQFSAYVDACVASYRGGSDEALHAITGDEDVPAVVFREAIARIVEGDVTQETGGVLDRDQARHYLRTVDVDELASGADGVLDLLAGCVRPAAIDYEELLACLDSAYPGPVAHHEAVADRILALVRPAPGGVTLTPEEAALALGAVHRDFNGEPSPQARDRLGALAARLKAVQ